MRKELVTTLSLVVNVLTFFAGVWYNQRRHKKDNSEARVQRVFEKYMEFRRTNARAGCDGALKAGIATLQTNAEILAFAALSLVMANCIHNHPYRPACPAQW